jgi:hypothetical protein
VTAFHLLTISDRKLQHSMAATIHRFSGPRASFLLGDLLLVFLLHTKNFLAAALLESPKNCGLSNVDKSQITTVIQVCDCSPQSAPVDQLMTASW